MGGGSTHVHVPGPSSEERALARSQSELLQLQTEILNQQRQQNAVLLPFMAKEFGFQVETDEHGNILSIESIDSERDEQRQRIEQMMLDRQEAALSGELPVDPGLERALTTQERDLRERLRQQFGPGFETSSPGIETLGDFFTQAETLRHGARTAEMTLGEQLLLSREMSNLGRQQHGLDNLMQGAVGNPMQLAGGFGQVAQGTGAALMAHPSRHHRELQTQANIASMQARTAQRGQTLGLIGSLGGAALGLFSDSRLKENLTAVGETKDGIPIYEYNLKGEDERRIGVLAEDVYQVKPWAVKERMGYLTVDYKELG